ncbi:tetratricopeptide repeat protein [Fontivita pretiosa]|uniref:tetratricopeptide repeat protein n=1 Tax=Fontivita pretiosa TaxID=2989684 RepID=UPI003D180754
MRQCKPNRRWAAGRVLAGLAAGMFVAAGCADPNRHDSQMRSGVEKLSSRDAAALSATHSRFEQSNDPPLNADTRFAAGQLAESQGQLDRALEQYRAALKADPKHQPSLYRMGMIYARAMQYQQALEVWKQYVVATNGSATAYSNLGFCYELAGQTREAEQAYLTGIRKEPNNQPCRINYGLMLARLGRAQEAEAHLATVLRPAEVHYNLASVYDQLDRKDRARAEYKKALELDPQMWEARVRLSRIE